jgi:TorA maturation chaperone TorD
VDCSRDDVEATLAARHYLYTLFQSLLGNEPSPERLDAVSLPLVQEAFAILGMDGDGNAAAGNAAAGNDAQDKLPIGELEQTPPQTPPQTPLRALQQTLQQAPHDQEGLTIEYTRLFVGPNKLPAPPWESVYISRERTLFQRPTLEVRDSYRSQGLIPELYPKVADDHIALELDFLRLLAGRAQAAFQIDEHESYQEALGATAEFLDEHLLRWVDGFAQDMARSGVGTFYPALAQMMAAYVRRDAAIVAEIVAESP